MAHRSVGSESKAQPEATRGKPQQDASAQRGDVTRHDRRAVQDFLDRFATAITSGDAKTTAELWETPAFVIDERAAFAVSDAAEVEKFFAGSKDQYNAQGVTTTRAEIQDLDWVTDNLVVARVRWPYLKEAGKTLGAEASSYTLKRDGDGNFKIRVVLMRGVEAADEPKRGKN